MAYIVGYVTSDERKELEARGWEVEDAEAYTLIGDHDSYLLQGAQEDDHAVVIFVDCGVLEVMSGPSWDTTTVHISFCRAPQRQGR